MDQEASHKHHSRHRQSLLAVSRRSSAVRMMELGSTSPGDPIDIPAIVPPNMMNMNRSNNVVKKQPSLSMMLTENAKKILPGRKMSIDEIEYEQCRLEPKVENRIVIINDEVLGQQSLK